MAVSYKQIVDAQNEELFKLRQVWNAQVSENKELQAKIDKDTDEFLKALLKKEEIIKGQGSTIQRQARDLDAKRKQISQQKELIDTMISDREKSDREWVSICERYCHIQTRMFITAMLCFTAALTLGIMYLTK